MFPLSIPEVLPVSRPAMGLPKGGQAGWCGGVSGLVTTWLRSLPKWHHSGPGERVSTFWIGKTGKWRVGKVWGVGVGQLQCSDWQSGGDLTCGLLWWSLLSGPRTQDQVCTQLALRGLPSTAHLYPSTETRSHSAV